MQHFTYNSHLNWYIAILGVFPFDGILEKVLCIVFLTFALGWSFVIEM